GMMILATVLFSVGTLATQPQSGGVLRAAMQTNPPTLDVHLSTNAVVRQIAPYIFETLVVYAEDYSIIPQLAASWDLSSDGLVYTFHLRSGVTFHNGKTLTADDVVASLERYIAYSPGGGRFNVIDAIAVVDPLTVEIRVKQPTLLLVTLAIPDPYLAIYPAEIVKGRQAEIRGSELIGTGPYRFAEWKPDVFVRLVRFSDYAEDTRFDGPSGLGGRRIAYFDEIQFIPVVEQASRLAGLLTGEFDYAEALPMTAYQQLVRTPDVTPNVLKPRWALVLELNQSEPPMDNVLFRRALVAALNMEDVLRAVTFGNPEFYRLQPGFFFPEQTVWHTAAGEEMYHRKDLAEVRRLLNAAGYNFEPIIFLSNRDYDWMYKCTLAVASQLQQAGINVVVEFSDWPSQIQRALTQKGWHINQTGWSPRLDPIQFTTSLKCGAPYAYMYCNPEVDGLLEELSRDRPLAERQRIFRELQQIIWEDVAVVRVGDFFTLEGTSSRLKGYTPWYVIPRFWNSWKE
ncbi:MAG: ABC transporter substrate-binding protein, partial [Candidatus Zipacnadales bacterium]